MLHSANCTNLRHALSFLATELATKGTIRENQTWQGLQAHQKMFEINHISFQSPIPPDWAKIQEMVKPNLPWADNHFAERVGGIPTNPGEEYKNWPYYPKNDKAIRPDKFTHTYQERFWPKYANTTNPPNADYENRLEGHKGIMGIRYYYGDLKDVINLLKKDPYTRQAYLPIWFPEDTGAVHGGRVPCTLGYFFNMQEGKNLDITYYIRSCDFLRHLRDDIYMAIKLLQHVASKVDHFIYPGTITMHIENLHVFDGEQNLVKL